ncbi:MAG: TlpA disulfide reductase family protein [Candidatus Omnitrophota bacterium]
MKFSIKSRIFLSVILILTFVTSALASDIILNDLNGKSVNLSSYKNKPTILFFWTTWCPYCRKEIKELNRMYAQMKKEGILVFAINIGETEYKVKNFFKNYELNLRVLVDRQSLTAEKYDIMGVPTYVFIADSGNIVADRNNLPEDYKTLLFKLKR